MDGYNYIDGRHGVNICYGRTSFANIDNSELSEYRKNRLKQLKTDKSKRQSMAVEAVFAANMKKNYPHICIPLRYTADTKGKPYFTDNCGIYFSLSHSGELAVCVAAMLPVGADVQAVKSYNEAIAKRYFTIDEYSMAKNDDKMFTRIWTRKEAVAKAEGTGISIGLNLIDVSDNEVLLNGERYYVEDVAAVTENYCMATAVKLDG